MTYAATPTTGCSDPSRSPAASRSSHPLATRQATNTKTPGSHRARRVVPPATMEHTAADNREQRLSDDGQCPFFLERGQPVLHLAGDLLVDLFELGLRSEALAKVDRRL